MTLSSRMTCSPRPPSATAPRLVVAALVLAVAGAALLAGCGAGKSSPAGTAGGGGATPGGAGAASAAAPRQQAAAGSGAAMRRAATAYDAFTHAFYAPAVRGANYVNAAGATTSAAVFWRQAELIEMTEDAYLASPDPALKQQIVALLSQVRYEYGTRWTRRTWNDDIEWMIIAAVRAWQITGDQRDLTVARRNFDAVWARAYSPQMGGGLWWITGGSGTPQKNVTTNATATIAAALLAQATHDQAYLAKAEQLYAWLRSSLYDPRTGAVYDNLTPATSGSGVVTDKAGLTYNQGTFVGAAGLLYQATHRRQYYADALKAIAHTRTVMSHGGLLPAEAGTNGNLLGFKGIFVRWATDFLRVNHITTYDAWLRRNAAAAWSHRDQAGLVGPDWSKVTPPSGLDSWGASSAVVLFEGLARR